MSEETLQSVILDHMRRIEDKLDKLSETSAGRLSALESEVALLKQRMWLISSSLALVFSAVWNLFID